MQRGTGKLTWGWFKYGTNSGYFNGSANYTGDTVIKAGGIELATPSGEEPNMVLLEAAKFGNGSWVELTARIEIRHMMAYRGKGPVFKVEEMSYINPPESELVYFN